MKIFFSITIIFLAYIIYGVYKKDFVKKNLDMINRYFPSFLIWPKDPKKHEMLCKIMLPLFFVIFFILLIMG